MSQLAIDFEPRQLARHSDPLTSHEAAESANELQARHHRIILAALEQHGNAGKDRIAALTSLNGVQVCRRLTELERAGEIEPTGKTVKSTAGRNEREWRRVVR
jgi:predicted ArsR family transcriptional regulator